MENKTCDSGEEKAVETGTPFQNCLQFDVGFEPMYDGQKHHPGLCDPKGIEKRKGVGRGERSQNEQDQNHGVEQLKSLLKDFVFEFSA